MIWSKTLWHKSWLESRIRFVDAAAVVALVIGWDILDSKHGMSRFDRVPPITFTQYVAYLFTGHLQWVWVASVLLLGMGGLVREDTLGTAQFTLTLPFRRREWMRVRAVVGLMQAAVLALIPVLVIPLAARFAGHSYPVWEAFKFSGLLFAAGLVFFFGGIFWSSLWGGEFAAIAVSGVSVFLAFTAQDYLYRWIPSFQFSYFNMNAFLGGYEFLNRWTGFLDGWPWPGILKSVCVAGVLFWSSTVIVERRDF
jgi:ABC-type transport system involved in multi-copper enzyme maturation permease subunit